MLCVWCLSVTLRTLLSLSAIECIKSEAPESTASNRPSLASCVVAMFYTAKSPPFRFVHVTFLDILPRSYGLLWAFFNSTQKNGQKHHFLALFRIRNFPRSRFLHKCVVVQNSTKYRKFNKDRKGSIAMFHQ